MLRAIRPAGGSMSRTRVALLADLCWLAAALGALAALVVLGVGPLTLGLAALLLVIAGVAVWWLGRHEDRRAADQLAALGHAVGLTAIDETARVESIVQALCQRIERTGGGRL